MKSNKEKEAWGDGKNMFNNISLIRQALSCSLALSPSPPSTIQGLIFRGESLSWQPISQRRSPKACSSHLLRRPLAATPAWLRFECRIEKLQGVLALARTHQGNTLLKCNNAQLPKSPKAYCAECFKQLGADTQTHDMQRSQISEDNLELSENSRP